ncbi:MAG: HDOD domain-containing protein [Pseudomonadota bacterium]
MKQIQSYISQMPSLSTTVTKVVEICNSPKTSPNDLNRVISLDPVLTGMVLRMVNSAYYALPNKVTSLTRAIVMLGINTVKNLALSTAVLASMGGKESFQAISADDFWSHSICTGIAAKYLAGVKGVQAINREEYFVAGLLHDLGKIPINYSFPDEYSRVLGSITLDGSSPQDAEREVFGIDHCKVGKMIIEKWQLGNVLKAVLYHHHNPAGADDETRNLVSIVALANKCVNILESGASMEARPDASETDEILRAVGVDESVFSEVQDAVLNEMEKARVFLQIVK